MIAPAPAPSFTDLDDWQCDRDYQPRPAAWPTAAPTGSAAKIEIMRERAERGEALYHPLDSCQPIAPQSPKANASGIREVALRA